jgi:hypothetical protein
MIPGFTPGTAAALASAVIFSAAGSNPSIASILAANAGASVVGGITSGAPTGAIVSSVTNDLAAAVVAKSASYGSTLAPTVVASLVGMASSAIRAIANPAAQQLAGSAEEPALYTSTVTIQAVANASTTQTQDLQTFYLASTGQNYAAGNKQLAAFGYFQQAWWGRQIFSVETPWGIYTNMAIADVRAVQPKESKYVSDFTIIFERIRVTGESQIAFGQLAGRNALQNAAASPVQNNAGQITPTPAQAASFNQQFNAPSLTI